MERKDESIKGLIVPDYLDDEDLLAILSIGNEKLQQTKIQKISYILSNITDFKGKFTAYKYGNFSETIMEKIQNPINRNIYCVKDDYYSLTPEGKQIYKAIIENFKISKEILDLLNSLRRLNVTDLEAITYHLFPEMAKNSKIEEQIEARITELKKKGKNKATREGNTVTLIIH